MSTFSTMFVLELTFIMSLLRSALTEEHLDLMKSHWEYRALGKPRIVNGVNAKIEEYPYMVLLLRFNEHYCGGTLLSSELVLTAAHCMFTPSEKYKLLKIPPSELAAVAGVSDRRTINCTRGHERRNIKAIYPHNKFDPKTMDHDVGVMKLSSKILEGPFIKYVSIIQPSDVVNPGDECYSLGWGYDKPNVVGAIPSSGSDILQVVNLRIISLNECKERLSIFGAPMSERDVCTYEEGKDACQGDSGGPLMCNDKQLAVVSYGFGCAQKSLPGVFYSINDTHLWGEDDEMRKNSSSTARVTLLAVFALISSVYVGIHNIYI